MISKILRLLIFSMIIWTTSSYKILFMCPFPAPSHWLWLEHFARGLIDRGHELTVITNFKTKEPHQNYTEIIIDPPFDIPLHYPKKNIFDMKFNSDFQNLFMWWTLGQLTTEHALNNQKVKALMSRKNVHFDLIIMEQFFHESLLMYGHKYKAPIVTIGTMGYADNMDRAMGLLTPWSFVPHIVVPYSDRMTFSERVYNTFLSIFDLTMRRIYYLPQMQKIAEKYFSTAPGEKLPSLLDLEKSISIMLINNHRSINPPRPLVPGLINVGGVHIKPVKPLPNDVKTFLDGAKQGAIYFSLGSYVKSIEMPPEKVAIIIETFRKLKQRVLWKYEDESIANLPQNVMVKKWLPQNDVLAHNNIVLFMTHGGIFGTQEGIYHGVPMLFIPLYGDQYRNTLKCIRKGLGQSMDFSKLTVDSLHAKIIELVNNKKYGEEARKLSLLFKDNPIHPMDESMYWIEYVMKHRGAKHLKSAAVELTWWQYLLLDVFLFYFTILFGAFYSLYKISYFLLSVFSKTKINIQKKMT